MTFKECGQRCRKMHTLTKTQEAKQKINREVIRLITDRSRLSLSQQLNNYFQLFCCFENNKALWEDIEMLFDSPVVLNSFDNEYADRAKIVMESFLTLMRRSNFYPRKWGSLAKDVFDTHYDDLLTLEDFRKGLRKLCRSNEVKVWPQEDVEFLYNHLCDVPYVYSSDSPIDHEPGTLSGFTFKLAFQLHALTSRKRQLLNEVATVTSKLSDFAASKAIILRCLKNGGTKGPFTDECVSKEELGSCLSILITDFSSYQAEKHSMKESSWLERTCSSLLESDVPTIVTPTIVTDFDDDLSIRSMDGNSVAGQATSPKAAGRSFTVGYRLGKEEANRSRNMTDTERAMAKKVKEDKDTYSLSRNKTLLVNNNPPSPPPSNANSPTNGDDEVLPSSNGHHLHHSDHHGHHGHHHGHHYHGKHGHHWMEEEQKRKEQEKKEKTEKLMKTIQAAKHVSMNKKQYSHIFDETETVTGEDLILLRNNKQAMSSSHSHSLGGGGHHGGGSGRSYNPEDGLSLGPRPHSPNRGSMLPPVNHSPSKTHIMVPVISPKVSASDKPYVVAYRKELLQDGTYNTEQQEKYFQSIITKFDYHIDKTLRRMTTLRGEAGEKLG